MDAATIMKDLLSQRETTKITPSTKDSSSAKYKCPTCKDRGWIMYQVSPSELEYVYGKDNMGANDYARKCPDCNGGRKFDEDLTGVPESFRFSDISKFDFDIYSKDISNIRKIANSFVKDFNEWRNYGKGLYIFSKTPGSGKTFLASCLGKSVMVKYDIVFKFITAPDYINKVGQSYKDKEGPDGSYIYRTCDLLVLDDIGAQIGKEWQQQEMFRLVDERMKHGLLTIYTSNLDIEGLNVDERTKSRIMATAVRIQMPEEGIRSEKSKSEQEAFLQKILKGEVNGT